MPEAVEAIRAEFLHVADRRSATLTALMAYAGLRPGEAIALEARHLRGTTHGGADTSSCVSR